eukprot:CAMPEP_0177578464 /NCGR_PEP_ID=MMETSP0419_2-20121207/363_1 /TAXON_ID=582737 /ORGANISM="Tetraselmis sp., Strain GSL018" /LENGTH=244 /DNA_ID=CAMNT_0019066911 /DNA_START=429 /DNA_END=1164 /DNA_ORIENTATION=+
MKSVRRFTEVGMSLGPTTNDGIMDCSVDGAVDFILSPARNEISDTEELTQRRDAKKLKREHWDRWFVVDSGGGVKFVDKDELLSIENSVENVDSDLQLSSCTTSTPPGVSPDSSCTPKPAHKRNLSQVSNSTAEFYTNFEEVPSSTNEESRVPSQCGLSHNAERQSENQLSQVADTSETQYKETRVFQLVAGSSLAGVAVAGRVQPCLSTNTKCPCAAVANRDGIVLLKEENPIFFQLTGDVTF